METIKPKKRFEYLDVAKCLAIFLVIVGHTAGNLDEPLYRVILYLFHMPLFFMISGIVIRRPKAGYSFEYWKSFLVKNFLALMVPYYVWALIYSQFTFYGVLQVLYASWKMLNSVGTLTSLWFLPCLFVARVIMEIILWLSTKIKLNSHIFCGILAIPAFAIGFLLPKVEIGYFMCFDSAFIALGFLLIGFAIKKVLKYICEQPWWVSLLLFIAFAVIFVNCLFINNLKLTLVLICSSVYGNIFWFFVFALSGSFAMLFLSVVISKIWINKPNNCIRKCMMWIGTRTLSIFLLHKPILQMVIIPWFESFGCVFPNFGWAVVVSIVSLLYSIILTFILEKTIPQIVGLSKKGKKVI